MNTPFFYFIITTDSEQSIERSDLMGRKPLVGISLKIYQNKIAEAVNYAQSISQLTNGETDLELFILPSMGVIYPVAQALHNRENVIGLGAQNIAPLANGALTGEFSIESLVDLQGHYVEIGHYERRTYFHEDDELINQKIQLTLKNQLVPLLCIGEAQQTTGTALKTAFKKILAADLANISPAQLATLIIAYEPYWAIGKASAAQASYVALAHTMIREALAELIGPTADNVRIIYGGSVSKDTAGSLVNNPNVDGVFVGRFGHDPQNFAEIVQIVKQVKLQAN